MHSLTSSHSVLWSGHFMRGFVLSIGAIPLILFSRHCYSQDHCLQNGILQSLSFQLSFFLPVIVLLLFRTGLSHFTIIAVPAALLLIGSSLLLLREQKTSLLSLGLPAVFLIWSFSEQWRLWVRGALGEYTFPLFGAI